MDYYNNLKSKNEGSIKTNKDKLVLRALYLYKLLQEGFIIRKKGNDNSYEISKCFKKELKK